MKKEKIIKACCFVGVTICLISVFFCCTNTAFYAGYQTAKGLYVRPKANQLTDDNMEDGITMNAVDNLNGLECLFVDMDEVEKLLAGDAGDEEDIEELPAEEDNNDQQDVTVEPICVPVILSEDGSFWYDQYARKMSMCTATAFFADHDGYRSKIIDLNNNDRYLSRWCRDQRRRNEIERMLIPMPPKDQADKNDEQTIVLTVRRDEVCQQAVEAIINDCHSSLETLAELQECSDSPYHIDVLTRMIWNRSTVYGNDDAAAEYLFWNTVALLIDQYSYSIDDINREFKYTAVDTSSDQQYSPSSHNTFDEGATAQPVPINLSGGSTDEGYSMDGPSETPDEDENAINNGSGQTWAW